MENSTSTNSCQSIAINQILSLGYCGIQYTQAVPYTSPDSFDLSSLSTVTGAVNVSLVTDVLNYGANAGLI